MLGYGKRQRREPGSVRTVDRRRRTDKGSASFACRLSATTPAQRCTGGDTCWSGETVISGDSKGFLTAFALDGKKLRDFIRHEGDAWVVTPSLDGRYLVSGSDDQNLRLWNPKTRKLLVTLFPRLGRQIGDVDAAGVLRRLWSWPEAEEPYWYAKPKDGLAASSPCHSRLSLGKGRSGRFPNTAATGLKRSNKRFRRTPASRRRPIRHGSVPASARHRSAHIPGFRPGAR